MWQTDQWRTQRDWDWGAQHIPVEFSEFLELCVRTNILSKVCFYSVTKFQIFYRKTLKIVH